MQTAGAVATTIEPDWKSRFLAVITDPGVALILMMIGIYGLFFEFSNPGFVLPGVAGAICLVVALFALHMLPVNYAGLALILLGLAFFVAEAFVPSYGSLSVGGIIAFAIGAVLLIDSDVPGFGVPRSLIAGLAVVSAVFVALVSGVALKARRRPVVSGSEELIGSVGVARGRHRARGLGARSQRAMARREPGSAQARADGASRDARRARPDGRPGGEGRVAMGIGFGLGGIVLLVAILVISSFRVLREYERGVVFMLGRFWRVKGPGLVLVIAGVQQMVRVDLRTIVLDVPPQDVITRDNVSVKVNAVVYFRVVDPEKSVIQVAKFLEATSQLAQTTLRAVLGKHELDELLPEREKLNSDIQRVLDAQTDAWGIKVSTVEIKHVDLNESMIRAIARQAEAERERRAKIIHAEGELQASEKLLQAAQMLAQQPQAMQLRYLQTLGNIAGDRSSTIVFPVPIDLVTAIGGAKRPA